MDSPSLLLILADVVLILHAAFVLFVVCGLLCVIAGKFARWPWVSNPWFRMLHLLAIIIVMVQAWLGIVCPLTKLENYLRTAEDVMYYQGSFIQHWVEFFLYYDAPAWVFALLYTVFGGLVIYSWFLVPPDFPEEETTD
jgi:hypothetical protein